MRKALAAGLFVMVALAMARSWRPVPALAAGDHAALVALSDEFQPLRRPRPVAGVVDYSAGAVDQRRRQLTDLRKRLDAIDPHGWPVPDQVDYLLVRAQMDAVDFDLRVMRPWARDPLLYLDAVRRLPFAEIPVPANGLAAFQETLRAVPAVLDQARQNLKDPSGELTRVAIFHLEHSDGVNQDEPRRTAYPEGTIGWYQDLLSRAQAKQPAIVSDVQRALTSVTAYRDWLKQNHENSKTPAAIGLDDFNWYVKHVRLMPYTASDMKVVATVEFARSRSFLKIDEHRNRKLPAQTLVKSGEEHEARVREAESFVRSFTKEEGLLTIPADAPAEFETDAFWTVRPDGRHHFWEQLTYRDPLNNHIHASIPGHQFDGFLQRKNARPIRRTFQDGPRAEGWGFYLEEMYLQAGLLEKRPRTRELFYIAQLARAARIPAELGLQTGTFTLQQAVDYMVREVPYMDPYLARYDLEIYLRRPAYGMNYIMGKLQIEDLLSDRSHQLGDKFDLGRFHDEFLAAGSIPIALIRWEMTGLDDQVKQLW